MKNKNLSKRFATLFDVKTFKLLVFPQGPDTFLLLKFRPKTGPGIFGLSDRDSPARCRRGRVTRPGAFVVFEPDDRRTGSRVAENS